jgi:hypothetical protein
MKWRDAGMAKLTPHVMAKVRLYTNEEGGRSKPIPAIQFSCPLFFQGEGFDCRLLLDQAGIDLPLGGNAVVPIKFLFPEHIVPRLKKGDQFRLWEGKEIAVGEVLEVISTGSL